MAARWFESQSYAAISHGHTGRCGKQHTRLAAGWVHRVATEPGELAPERRDLLQDAAWRGRSGFTINGGW